MIKYPLAYNPIIEYWNKIESGEEVVGRKIRIWYKHLARKITEPETLTGEEAEYFYSAKRANHILEFAENYCRLSKGSNKPVRLELWEKAHLAAVFGFIDIEGNRQYRESILIVGKKNGKQLFIYYLF